MKWWKWLSIGIAIIAIVIIGSCLYTVSVLG